jgi:hypothetical protein
MRPQSLSSWRNDQPVLGSTIKGDLSVADLAGNSRLQVQLRRQAVATETPGRSLVRNRQCVREIGAPAPLDRRTWARCIVSRLCSWSIFSLASDWRLLPPWSEHPQRFHLADCCSAQSRFSAGSLPVAASPVNASDRRAVECSRWGLVSLLPRLGEGPGCLGPLQCLKSKSAPTAGKVAP